MSEKPVKLVVFAGDDMDVVLITTPKLQKTLTKKQKKGLEPIEFELDPVRQNCICISSDVHVN